MPQMPKVPTAKKLAQPVPKSQAAPKLDITAEITAASKALAPAVKRLTAALAKLDVKKVPVGALADTLYDIKAVAKLVPNLSGPFDDVLGPAVKALEEHFIQTLKVGESSGVQGTYSRIQVNEHPVPIVKPEDWIKFWTNVAKTKQWDLLPRSVNTAAVKERWDDKKQVKFVGVFHAKKVSCTKLGGKK